MARKRYELLMLDNIEDITKAFEGIPNSKLKSCEAFYGSFRQFTC